MNKAVQLACALSGAALLVSPAPALAGAGVAGADILKVPVEARGWGLGTAYSAIADDVGAMAYNPAGLSQSGMREFRFTYMSLVEGTGLFSLLGGWPLGRWGTVGGMILYRSIPTINNFDPEFDPHDDTRGFKGLTGGVDVSDSVLGIYTAFRFSHLIPGMPVLAPFSCGIGVKSASMSIAGFHTNATAVDIGFQYAIELFKFGLVLQNVGGGYKFAGTVEAEADALPSTLRLAVAFVAYEDSASSLTLAVEDASYVLVSNSQKFGDTVRTASEYLNLAGFGVEYWRLKKMGVRLGYVAPWWTGASSYTGGRGIAVGATFRIFADYVAYQIDIAYRPMSIGSARQDAGTVSLSLRF
jgi:hypothetical protein